MSRRALVLIHQKRAGVLEEKEEGGYRFSYDPVYLGEKSASPVSLTLPLREAPYESETLFSFFDGLIPEGWLLDLSVRNWKLAPNDRMGLLLEACVDCIGSVSIQRLDDE